MMDPLRTVRQELTLTVKGAWGRIAPSQPIVGAGNLGPGHFQHGLPIDTIEGIFDINLEHDPVVPRGAGYILHAHGNQVTRHRYANPSLLGAETSVLRLNQGFT